MFLFIFESIGMQELILIGAIALIVFGPRKLPQMMRKAGKLMAEFRSATSDFKNTWEKEVDFEDYKETNQIKPVPSTDNAIQKDTDAKPLIITSPEIKEIKQEDFGKLFPAQKTEEKFSEQSAKAGTGKQDWL